MEIGLVLPTIGPGAGRESVEAGAETAVALGWTSVWVTDHLLVPRGSEADEYGTILEALVTLSYVAARFETLTVGTSAIIPPMRNPVVLAKELATLDVLSRGRLVVGVGVADRDDAGEFRNLGMEHRMSRRGDLVDESIALWRHLWSGDPAPFAGEFHHLDDYVFRPLPPQKGAIPIWTGGRSDRALVRAARLADGYHAARTGPDDLAERLPLLRRLCEEVDRPLPTLSVRARVHFRPRRHDVYTIGGSAAEMRDDVRRFARLGVEHLIVVLDETEPARITAAARRLHDDVIAPALD
jgi:probable F420-dependent oxidoreductase